MNYVKLQVNHLLTEIFTLLSQSSRPLVKSAYQNNSFLISQRKHMLWVLKRTVSLRRFF